ncbi:transporter substrate-binding domain-containing protein [Pseudomonas corrugata]|uniref:transporter substrate-binding domain-containing protein n=1 Tax=Pseudomonas corrugata TaxID=47879 RepID=UPI00158605CC|nr:transporter substrate-binding domain-containing protein [Pseudomonas corrugata]MCI0995183.1 transporter substrate-binding domain-containing protein [Pseudomonas corrugata]NUT64664.1 transporter substrate-binding domain-containing protein [Pseudomonas corrugata]
MKSLVGMKRSAVLLACLLATGQSFAAAEENASLRMATSLGYPPFEYLGADGKMTGFEIDLGNAICAQLKRVCVWQDVEFSSMVPGLKARKFDAMLASIAVTGERKQQVLFTDKVYGSTTRLLAHKDSTLTTDFSTLIGKRIGVEQGTTNERFAKKHWQPKGVSVISYPNQDMVYSDLISGRLDGVVIVDVQAQLGFLSSERGADYELIGERIFDPQVGGDDSAIAVNKSNQKLVDELNAALAALHADGTYDQLAKKYFPANINIYGN